MEEIKEINQHIKDALKQWSDIMLNADADEWAYQLNYDSDDMLNTVMIFQHVLSNIGIKNGTLDTGEKAEEVGAKLREVVIGMTGFDPATEIQKP